MSTHVLIHVELDTDDPVQAAEQAVRLINDDRLSEVEIEVEVLPPGDLYDIDLRKPPGQQITAVYQAVDLK